MISLFDYSERKEDRFLIWSGIFVALGFLVKGLTIIALGGMVNFLYFIYQRKQLELFQSFLSWKAWLAFIIVALPWLVLIIQNLGTSEFKLLIFRQTFGRFTNTFEKHDGPFFYYLLILPILLLPYFWDAIKGLFKLHIRNNKFESFIYMVYFCFGFLFILINKSCLTI